MLYIWCGGLALALIGRTVAGRRTDASLGFLFIFLLSFGGLIGNLTA